MMRSLLAMLCLLCTLNARAIVNGLDISESEMPAVKKLSIGGSGVCSGTFIGPHTMVTAAHCLRMAGGSVGGSKGSDLNLKVSGIAPSAYRINPRYVPDKGIYPYSEDVAVLEFPENSPSFKCTVVAPGAPAVGDRVQLAGYGLSLPDDVSTAGRKRKGNNVVAMHDMGQITIMWDTSSTPPRAVGLPGDSGGPLFNADGELVGVANEASGSKSSGYLVKLGGSRVRMGVYVDINESGIKRFLQSAVTSLGGQAPTLFRTNTTGSTVTTLPARVPAR